MDQTHEDLKKRELILCKKNQGDLQREITVLESQVFGILANRGVIQAREKTLSMDLNLLMQKINAEGYHNRHKYSVDEGNYRRDIAQAKDEIRYIEAQAEPMQRKLKEMRRSLKLLKKKEKRILIEIKTGLTIQKEGEEGTDNPVMPVIQWILNILGQNAVPKFIGLFILLGMVLYSIFG